MQKKDYATKRKTQVIPESVKILFQPKSNNFLSCLQSFLTHIKLCQVGFSSHSGF